MNFKIITSAAFILVLLSSVAAMDIQQTGLDKELVPATENDTTFKNVANYSVTTEMNESVNVITKGFEGDLKVDNSDVASNSSEDIKVFARLGIENSAGNYTGQIEFNNGTAVNKEFTLNLKGVTGLNVTPEQINFTANTGSSEEITGIGIQNTGNVELDTTVDIQSKAGNDIQKIIDINRRILIQPQTNREIISRYTTSDSQNPGSYNGTVVVKARNYNLTKRIPITAKVVDNQGPKMNLSVKDTNSTLANEITTNVKDNVGIKDVTAEIFKVKEKEVEQNNETVNVEYNDSVSNISLTPSGDDVYTQDFEDTKDLGKYHVVAQAQDASDNNVTVSESFEVEKLSLFNIDKNNINSDTAQTGTWSVSDAFKLSYNREVEITLEQFTYGVDENNSLNSATVQIVLPNGGKDFFSEEGENLTISQAGQYKIRVKGNKTEVYNARFSFSNEEWYEDTENIVITGNFREVATPDPISREWAGADWMKCSNTVNLNIFDEQYDYIQTNNLDEARYVCVIPFKYTSIGGDIENNAVPIPPEVYDKMNSQQEQTVQTLQDTNSKLRWHNWLKDIFIVLLVICTPLYILYKQRASVKLM